MLQLCCFSCMQLSQASSKLTRLRRAVPVGINHQMASELGHKVKAALKTVSKTMS